MSTEQPPGIVLTKPLLWALASAVAIIAGSLGTWVTAGPFSVSGTTQGDGVITLVLGVLGAVLVMLEKGRPLMALVAGAALAIGLIDASSVLRAPRDGLIAIDLGWGLIAVSLGGASLLAWSVRDVFLRVPRTRSAILVAAVVAVVVTAAVMGESGRFDVEDDDTDQEVAQIATQPTGATTGEATAADAETQTTTGSTSAKPATRIGRVGDALTLTGSDGLVMRVTLTDVIDPLPLGEYEEPTNGKRSVGIELRLTNQSETATYDDSPSNGAALVLDDDRQADSSISAEECTNPNPRIRPGDSRKVCIPFEVGEAADLSTFQLALDSGFSDDGAEWALPARGQAAAPSQGADPPVTACDQNIKAGPSTTCGFADNVFREYAKKLQSGDESTSISLTATSPSTGRRYSVECESRDETVRCRASDGGFVRFPQWAAEVY